MKKLILFVFMIVTVTALVLAACSPSTPAPATKAPTTAPTSAPKPAPTSSPVPAPSPAPGQPPAVKPVEFSFAYQSSPTTETSKYALLPWSAKLEEAGKGKIKVTQYPSESLVKTTETFEGVKSGIASIGWAPMVYFTGLSPLTDVITLPFLLGQISCKQTSEVLWSLYKQFPDIQKNFAAVKVIALYSENSVHLETVKKPVTTLADLKGMKLRTSGDIYSRLATALGASPTAIAAPDLYSSLEKGVVDGMIGSFNVMSAFKAQEILKYYNDFVLGGSHFMLIMNQAKYDSLPPDVKQAVDSVSGDWAASFMGNGSDEIAGVYDKLIKEGNWKLQKSSLLPGEYEKFVAASSSVWDSWVATTKAKGLPAQEVLNATKALVAKYQK